jgi:hypothetical protein
MKFPFEEINMCDPVHVEWVKTQRDPALWHAAAIAVLVYLGDPHGFLLWLIDQPEMDRATAGYVFLGREGAGYLQGQTEFHGEGLSGRGLLRVLEALCRRAATVGFANDVLGLDPGFEARRQECLDLVERGAIAEGIVIPHAIINAPFPAEQKTAYFIEDGSILDYDPGPFPS